MKKTSYIHFFLFQLKKNEKKKNIYSSVEDCRSLSHTHTCRRDFAFKLRFIRIFYRIMHKIHIPNLGVEPSIFNWLSVSPLPARKPPKDRSRYKCTSSTTEERAEKDVNFKRSSCPSGAEEKAEMSCMDKDADFETICPLGGVEV